MFDEAQGNRNSNALQSSVQAQKQAQDYARDTPKSPEVNRALEEIGALLNDMNDLIVRVGNIADRISGPVPSEVGSTATSGVPQTLMGKLGIVFGAVKNMNGELRDHLGRIEKTV